MRPRARLPGFWDDAEAARRSMARLVAARDDVAAIEAARERLGDAAAALELGDETDDADLLAEAASIAERARARPLRP